MNNISSLPIKAINLGVKCFAEGMQQQNIDTIHVQWKPPVNAAVVESLRDAEFDGRMDKINAANQAAFNKLIDAEPYFVGIKKVLDVVPDFKENMILHSGPPISWDRMIKTQKRGIIGGILHEKLAKDEKEALGMIEAGEIIIESANDHFVIGAGAGIVTAHMVANISIDRKTGFEGYCIPFEGREGLSVWGVYNEAVENNLQIIENVFAPAVTEALQHSGGIDVRSIMGRGLQMGDDMHTRQTGASLILVNEIVPMLLDSGIDIKTIKYCIEQFTSTERWFHPLALSSCMAMIRAIKGMENCSIVTNIAQNGVETGIKIAGLGEKWFTAPSPLFTGQYFSTKWGPDDAAPFMGDSTISEVCGMGGFAGAAAPGVMRLRGGGFREGIAQSEEMKEIAVGVNHKAPLPALDFSGPGLGIDICKVVNKGITPICHGGIISKEGGQIGAGAARFPIAHYIEATKELLDSIK